MGGLGQVVLGNLALIISLCAPAIHPTTANALIQHESGGKPFAIGINGRAKLSAQSATEAQAIATAKALIAQGYSVDLGYAQINSRNLGPLGIKVDDIFKPCVNLQAMQTILRANYIQAAKQLGEGQAALQAALSAYNTGNTRKGLSNGYVHKLYRVAAKQTRYTGSAIGQGHGRASTG